MTKRRLIGPVSTIAAVAVVGAGLWLVSVSQTPDPPTQVAQTVAAPVVAAPAPEVSPARAKYSVAIPLPGRVLTLDISVDGKNAKAYACDNAGIETWLYGSADNGALNLTNGTGANRLSGQLRNGVIVGTLWIGERSWDFEAARFSDHEN